MDQEVLGGIYVVPAYTEIGVIEFRLCGILVPRSDDKWEICCPFIGRNTASADGSIGNGGGQDDPPSELTPINGKAEKGKDQKRKKR